MYSTGQVAKGVNEEEEAMGINSRHHLSEMSVESLSSSPPRTNSHATHSLVDLGSAFALGFLFDEFLRNEELGSGLFLVGSANIG